MELSKQMLFDWCAAHSEEQLTLLSELAALPAPSNHEEQRVAFIQNWLKEQGATNSYVDRAGNVLLPFGCDGRDKILVFMAHTDIVFSDQGRLPVHEEDGKLYAPGVGDDTANVVGLMMCAKFLLTNKLTPKDPVLLVFNTGEEGLGNLKGVRQLMSDFNGRIKEVVSFDGTYDAVVERAVGSERWRIRVTTCGGHSYGAFGNPNAIVYLSRLICRLSQQQIPQRAGRKTTYNVGTINGGTSVNTIAEEAEMTYEYRSDEKECLDQMRDQFMKIIDQFKCPEAAFELELVGERPCTGEINREEEERLLNNCSQLITDITGEAPARYAYSTDANLPLSLGIPATTFGLYLGAKAHTREEWVQINTLNIGLKIAVSLISSHFINSTMQ